jgi:molybdate transport system substrate-binding protein
MRKLLIVCSVVCALGCHSRSTLTTKSAQPELVVAAAANLTDAFAEIGPRFTSQTGVRVVFSFGATADLANQIKNGAPFDLFMSADTAHIDQLESQNLITPGSGLVYARGRLVMWSPPGSKLKLSQVSDLTAKEFERIAIAKPDVAPYGQAAIESLHSLGVWGQIEPKIIYAQSVAQARQYASTGNAEVAFIPLALVKPGEGSYVEVPEGSHQPIDQGLGIMADSPKQRAAWQFVDFVLGKEGQELLLKNGYSAPH